MTAARSTRSPLADRAKSALLLGGSRPGFPGRRRVFSVR